jgi:hypothetical protein
LPELLELANAPVDRIIDKVRHRHSKKGPRPFFEEVSRINDPLFTMWSCDSDLNVGVIVVGVDFELIWRPCSQSFRLSGRVARRASAACPASA